MYCNVIAYTPEDNPVKLETEVMHSSNAFKLANYLRSAGFYGVTVNGSVPFIVSLYDKYIYKAILIPIVNVLT